MSTSKQLRISIHLIDRVLYGFYEVFNEKLFHFDNVRTSWDSLRGQPSTADWLPIHIIVITVVNQWDCSLSQPGTGEWLPILIFISMVVTQWDCLRDQPCTAEWLPIQIFISIHINGGGDPAQDGATPECQRLPELCYKTSNDIPLVPSRTMRALLFFSPLIPSAATCRGPSHLGRASSDGRYIYLFCAGGWIIIPLCYRLSQSTAFTPSLWNWITLRLRWE